MTNFYERTEDGTTTRVTAEEALKEGREAMTDRVTVREHVRKIFEASGHYDITYKDGRHVVLRPIDEQSEPTTTPANAARRQCGAPTKSGAPASG